MPPARLAAEGLRAAGRGARWCRVRSRNPGRCAAPAHRAALAPDVRRRIPADRLGTAVPDREHGPCRSGRGESIRAQPASVITDLCWICSSAFWPEGSWWPPRRPRGEQAGGVPPARWRWEWKRAMARGGLVTRAAVQTGGLRGGDDAGGASTHPAAPSPVASVEGPDLLAADDAGRASGGDARMPTRAGAAASANARLCGHRMGVIQWPLGLGHSGGKEPPGPVGASIRLRPHR